MITLPSKGSLVPLSFSLACGQQDANFWRSCDGWIKSRHEVMPCSLSPAMKSITNSQRNARCVLGIWDVGEEMNQALNKQGSSKEFSITAQVFLILAPLPDTCDSNLSFSAHVKLRPIHIYINSRQHPPILNPIGYSWYTTCLAAKACHWLPARRTLLVLTSTWRHHVRCPLLATTHECVLLTPPSILVLVGSSFSWY